MQFKEFKTHQMMFVPLLMIVFVSYIRLWVEIRFLFILKGFVRQVLILSWLAFKKLMIKNQQKYQKNKFLKQTKLLSLMHKRNLLFVLIEIINNQKWWHANFVWSKILVLILILLICIISTTVPCWPVAGSVIKLLKLEILKTISYKNANFMNNMCSIQNVKR